MCSCRAALLLSLNKPDPAQNLMQDWAVIYLLQYIHPGGGQRKSNSTCKDSVIGQVKLCMSCFARCGPWATVRTALGKGCSGASRPQA